MPREIRRDLLVALAMLAVFWGANGLAWIDPLPWPYLAVLTALVALLVLGRWFVLARGWRNPD